MRTTLTLDEDLAAELKAVARKRGMSFKDAVNTTLRTGLNAQDETARPYRVPARPLGMRSDIDAEAALRLAGELEDAETLRKLELRK